MLKLSNFKIQGQDTFGEYYEGKVYPVSDKFRAKYRCIRSIIENNAIDDLKRDLEENKEVYPVKAVRMLPPISPGSRIFCVGLNYPKKYMLDSSMNERGEMILFSKELDSFVGSDCPIRVPTGPAGKSLDYEGELGIIIGKAGKDIKPEEVQSHIFGFTIVNDGSIRDWQKHSIFAGKNFECSSSCGPCILVNHEELRPETFLLTTKLNDQVVQKEKIETMIFKCEEIIAYVSTILTLKPGDVIATGSPEGSGMSQDPYRFLQDGDSLEIAISNIGVLRNNVVSFG